jgi:anaphase-promoting complex subunit 5
LHETHIDYLVSRGSYSEAFTAISMLAQSLKEDNADILQRVNVLLMKADLFRKVGKPERGFGVALRAASVAYKAKLMPSLWAAVGLLANILNGLGECSSAKRLIEGVIPQALEGSDNMLIGTLYSHLGDAYMGLADPSTAPKMPASPSSSPSANRSTAANVAKAELYIDRARECYKKSGYLTGECEQLMKKAIIAKLRGDEKLAEEWAQNHNRVWEEGMRGIEE